jgi:hypothetical protein
MINPVEYFNDNKYVVIRNFLPEDMCLVLYTYCKNKARAIDYKTTYKKEQYSKEWDGEFADRQAPGAYSLYGDPLMESILELSLVKIQFFTGLTLLPNYAYWRLYQKGNDLKIHKDRPSCEISTTLCLGYDVSDVDFNVYPEYDWPMWVKSPEGSEIPIHMKPGDMIIYRGCDIEHWRDEFIGKNHAQVFMHYNDANGLYKNIHDGRPFLGIPKHCIEY